jgi:hypothetical protein
MNDKKSEFTYNCSLKNKTTKSSVGIVGPASSLRDGYQKCLEWFDRYREPHWHWFLGDDLEVTMNVDKRK